VKQRLACIRMLFDWLVIGQVTQTSPAHSVRGPRHSVAKGVTPVLSSEEATALLIGMDISTAVGLHGRAIIAVMTYTFARVGAVVALTVEDYFPQKKRWWLRLIEKNGKLNEMPCHHKLEEFLDAYVKTAGIKGDRKGPLFRSAVGGTGVLTGKPMSRTDVWYMVRRRASGAGIETAIGATPSAPRELRTTPPTAGVSRSRSVWPDTRTRKPPAFTTDASATSAGAKWRGLESNIQ
jgi:site-specific recombinase XerD